MKSRLEVTEYLEKFISKSNLIHEGKYKYTKFKYTNARNKSTIDCPIHGEFQQSPDVHMKGHGCPSCSNNKKINTDIFKETCTRIHLNKYNYSNVIYKNIMGFVEIMCPKHGSFRQRARYHLKGYGCRTCNSSRGENKIENTLLDMNIEFTKQMKFENCKFKKELPFDFYLPEYNICIEYDGEQHLVPKNYFGGEKSLKYRQNNDKIKSDYCELNNIRLIRISHDQYNMISDILDSTFNI